MSRTFVFCVIIVAGCLALLGFTYVLWTKNMVKPRFTLTGTPRQFYCVAFSPDAKLVAGGQQDGAVQVWDTATGQIWFSGSAEKVQAYDFSAAVYCLAFDSRGEILAWGGGDRAIHLLDLKTKKLLQTINGHEREIRAIKFSPKGELIATATRRGLVRLWNLETRTARIVFDETKFAKRELGEIESIAFHPNGKELAVGILGAVVLLDISKEPAEARTIPSGNAVVEALAYAPDGKVLAGVGGTAVKFWDSANGKELPDLPLKREGSIMSIAFSPRGDMLAVARSEGKHKPGLVQLWQLASPKEIGRFLCHEKGVSRVAWSPDGKLIATCGNDHTVQIWDIASILDQHHE
jgi:WD40 repeat protein